MTSSARNTSRQNARDSARPAVVITRQPCSLASCTAMCPTPPAPAWISTVWPGWMRARRCSASQAVCDTSGSAAADGVIERRRLARRAACIHRHVLGVCAGTKQVGRGEELVADLPLRDARAAAHDAAADVVAQHQRPFARHTRARAHLGVHRIHRGCMYLDQHVGVAQRRLRQLLEVQHVGCAVLAQNHRAHRNRPVQ